MCRLCLAGKLVYLLYIILPESGVSGVVMLRAVNVQPQEQTDEQKFTSV